MSDAYSVDYDEDTKEYTAITNDGIIRVSSYVKEDTIIMMEGLIDLVFRSGILNDPS